MGKFKENMRKIRGNDRQWWKHYKDATKMYNRQQHDGLSMSTPNQAMDPDNEILQFRQQEKASDTLQESQRHADSVRKSLERDGAFRKPVQGPGLGKAGPRKEDPNYEGKLYKLTPGALQHGMISMPEEGIFIPQGNVRAFPRSSASVDITKDPDSVIEKRRTALKPIADRLQQVLQNQFRQQHLNRGVRGKIIENLKVDVGGQELTGLPAYLHVMKEAGLGVKTDDRARIARVAESFPELFERVNPGLGSERIQLIDV